MDGIFISYRRRDEPFATSLLVEKLEERYGEQQVFYDLDDIDTGEYFLSRIHRALESCAVLIAVIGAGWMKQRKKKLLRPDDPVRMEIGTALTKNVLVIPVLLNNAKMPEPDDLPDELKDFHYKNASRLRSTDLDTDIARLIERLDRVPQLAVAATQPHDLLQGSNTQHIPVLLNKQSTIHSGDTTDFVVCSAQSMPRFSLHVEEGETSLEFEGAVVTLNRARLDPGNLSISSTAHARFEYVDGGWKLTDLSSNKATFIAIDDRVALSDGDCLIFGSALFQFKTVIGCSAIDPDIEDTLPLAKLATYAYTVRPRFYLDQHGAATHTFDGRTVVVNRGSLDPDNASISRKEHARFDLCGGIWYITDLSSTNASFVQVRKTIAIAHGTALVFGRKVFTFRCSG